MANKDCEDRGQERMDSHQARLGLGLSRKNQRHSGEKQVRRPEGFHGGRSWQDPPRLVSLVLNTHSLRKKLIQLEALCQIKSVDLVFVTETWFPQRFNPVLFNYKHVISCTREDTDAGHSGGSTIFIKDAPYLTCTYARSFSPSEDCQICQVMINQITYICVYRSPSQKKSDVDKLTAFMKSLNEFPNLVVLGDLNIPSANWELMYTEDPDHRELVETFAELQVWNYVNVPTHRQGNILDLVLAQNNLVSDVQVDSESHFVSDHYPIVFIIENMQTEAIKNTMIKNHSLFDQEKYVSILRSTTWTLLDFSQVDTAVEQITSIVREAYDVCLPRFMASTHQEKKRFSPKTSAQISLVKYLTKHNGYAPGLAEAKRKLQEMLEKDRIAWQESYMKYLA